MNMLFGMFGHRRGDSRQGGTPPAGRAALVGLEAPVAAALEAMLSARELRTERFEQSAALLEAAQLRQYRLVACGYPLPDLLLRGFLERLRVPGGASRRASVLVVTIPELVPAAEQLIGRGANAVLRRHEASVVTEEVVNRLLQVAPRLDVGGRLVARLQDADTPPRECRVLNISVSGALLECLGAPATVGGLVRVELSGESLPEPVLGEARVVRRAAPGRETTRGFAVQFVTLEPPGRQRLEQLVACA